MACRNRKEGQHLLGCLPVVHMCNTGTVSLPLLLHLWSGAVAGVVVPSSRAKRHYRPAGGLQNSRQGHAEGRTGIRLWPVST